MEQTGSQRVACYDVLRVAATFAVVALHLSAQHWADTDIYSTATASSAGPFLSS